jgi:signal transduction histidine kinase
LQEEKFKIGLQNVENRIKSINGTITFESNNGLKVKINIPI